MKKWGRQGQSSGPLNDHIEAMNSVTKKREDWGGGHFGEKKFDLVGPAWKKEKDWGPRC